MYSQQASFACYFKKRPTAVVRVADCVYVRKEWNYPVLLEPFSVVSYNQNQSIHSHLSQITQTIYSEPIKTQSNYMHLTQSAGKRVVAASHDYFHIYFWPRLFKGWITLSTG